MNYNIPVRLAKLRKHQVDIILELKKEGIVCYPSELSKFLNGIESSPKAGLVLSEADKIVSRWEHADT